MALTEQIVRYMYFVFAVVNCCLFSTVFQDYQLFAFSIKENIVLDINLKSDDEIFNYLKKSGLENKVRTLSKGLDTSVY